MGEPGEEALGRVVDEDHDEAGTEYYEHFSDPTNVTVERAQRRYQEPASVAPPASQDEES
jgi:hypothetical protein